MTANQNLTDANPFFALQATDGDARAALLHTPHGSAHTPAFMPVATQGSVKAVDAADLRAAGARVLLSNTYHLYLRPGAQAVQALGGLHRFMRWQGPNPHRQRRLSGVQPRKPAPRYRGRHHLQIPPRRQRPRIHP